MTCPTETNQEEWKQCAAELAACVKQMRDAYWWDKTVPIIDADNALTKYETLKFNK